MPGFGLRRAPERQMKTGVIRTGNPRIPAAAAALLGRQTFPRVAPGLTRIGRRVEPPDSRAGLGIDRSNEAADAFRAVDAGDDLSFRRKPGARRGRVAIAGIVMRGVERLLAVLDVDGIDLPVRRKDERFIVVEHEPAAKPPGGSGRSAFGHLVPVLPQEIARGGIEGVHDAAGHGEKHDAVVDDGAGPIIHIWRAALLNPPRPDEFEILDVVLVDLVERAVALRVVGSPEHQPIARRPGCATSHRSPA